MSENKEYVSKNVTSAGEQVSATQKGNATDFERAKKEKSEKRRIEKALATYESKIEQVENDIKKLKDDVENNGTNFEKLTELYESISKKEDELEELYLKYDEIISQKEQQG